MYLADLIGVPYKVHGRNSEEGFDCYGLAIEVLKRYGKKLPDFLYASTERNDRNEVYQLAVNGIKHTELERPEEGCLVMLNIIGEPNHCGVYIGGGKIIHTTRNKVVIENIKRWENRIYGYYKINY